MEGMREETPARSSDLEFPRPSPVESEEAIRAVLSQDHECLERQFESIVAEASGGDPSTLRQAWLPFERELLRHFDDEEKHILPAFALQKPTEAHALFYEHQRIRNELTTLAVDLDLHSCGRTASRISWATFGRMLGTRTTCSTRGRPIGWAKPRAAELKR